DCSCQSCRQLAEGDLGRLGQDGENAIAAFARSANGGLIVTGTPSATVHRNLIVTLATEHQFPAVYYYRSFVTAGGLRPQRPLACRKRPSCEASNQAGSAQVGMSSATGPSSLVSCTGSALP